MTEQSWRASEKSQKNYITIYKRSMAKRTDHRRLLHLLAFALPVPFLVLLFHSSSRFFLQSRPRRCCRVRASPVVKLRSHELLFHTYLSGLASRDDGNGQISPPLVLVLTAAASIRLRTPVVH